MAGQAGYLGTVLIDASTLGLCTNATLDKSREQLDATYLGVSDASRRKIYGLKDATISLDCDYDSADAGQAALISAESAGTQVTVQFLPDGTNGFSGPFHVASVSFVSDPAGKATVSFSLEANGAMSVV